MDKAQESSEMNQGQLADELNRLREQLVREKQEHEVEMQDLQIKLRNQKDQEINELRLKYEKIIDELKKNSTNDREFV